MRFPRRIEPGAAKHDHARPGRSPGRRKADHVLPVLGTIAFLYFARPVVLPVIIACVASMALKPGMLWFARWHVPSPVSAAVMVLGLLAAAGCFFYYVARPGVEWVRRAPAATGEMRQKVEKILHIRRDETPPPKTGDISQPAPLPMPDTKTMSTILSWTGATLEGLVEIIVLLYVILISDGWFPRKLAELLAPRFDPKWVIESLNELQGQISGYLLYITLINATFGLIIGAGLALIGLPNAAMWGGIAAVLNYILYFGPIVGMTVVGLVGLLTFDSFPRQILPLALYLGMHLLEADVVTPIFLGQRFTIHPLLIFVSLLFWTWLWGIPGALLAVPILVALKVACGRLPALAPLGVLLNK